MGHWQVMEWIALVEHELLLFAGVFFLLGTIDELAIDVSWAWLRLSGRVKSWRIQRDELRHGKLAGGAAVLIPAWQEAKVIEYTIAHALRAWPHAGVRIYAGCYCNDQATMEAIMRGAGGDTRVRVVVHARQGPTTKADCLNRLYSAVGDDEARSGVRFRLVMLHDAEDMVDPAALALVDRAMDDYDFVQLPVLPEPNPASRWIGNHYCEEFAEAHGKAMVVRSALGASLPAAGVGCAFSRNILSEIDSRGDGEGPFSVESLTEDYELGMRIKAAGGTSRFLRVRGEDGRLVATRAYFPAHLEHSVRQKARWVHGISLQGWDRLGWGGNFAEHWMRSRDRRGPLTAVVLFAGYVMLALASILWLAGVLELMRPWKPDPFVSALLTANLAGFGWRAIMRFGFTAREYGVAQGLMAVARIPLTNVIAIMAGKRALAAYARTLRGSKPVWDKTVHDIHPAAPALLRRAARQPE